MMGKRRRRTSVKANINAEARSNRRNIEDKVCDGVVAGRIDPEEADLSTSAHEVANPWNWD